MLIDYTAAYDHCDYYMGEKLCKEQNLIQETWFNEVHRACETVKGEKIFCHCYYNDPINPTLYYYTSITHDEVHI